MHRVGGKGGRPHFISLFLTFGIQQRNQEPAKGSVRLRKLDWSPSPVLFVSAVQETRIGDAETGSSREPNVAASSTSYMHRSEPRALSELGTQQPTRDWVRCGALSMVRRMIGGAITRALTLRVNSCGVTLHPYKRDSVPSVWRMEPT